MTERNEHDGSSPVGRSRDLSTSHLDSLIDEPSSSSNSSDPHRRGRLFIFMSKLGEILGLLTFIAILIVIPVLTINGFRCVARASIISVSPPSSPFHPGRRLHHLLTPLLLLYSHPTPTPLFSPAFSPAGIRTPRMITLPFTQPVPLSC